MALPTSPPISLNQIKAEFGATGTRSLTEFYRGGPFVPNIPANSNIPTSGTISLLDFLGAMAAPAVTWEPRFAFDMQPEGSFFDAFAQIEIGSDRKVRSHTSSQGATTLFTWSNDSTPVSEFSVRAVRSSGVTPSGPSLNTWHSLSSSRLWGVESSSGTVTSILDLTLRHNPTGLTWTAQMNLQAQKGSPI